MDNKEKIIEVITSKQKTIKEVAKILKITEKQLRFLLEKWGVDIPKRERKRVPMPDRETLLRLYDQNGTTTKVAKELGVNINTITKWIKELKIPTRRLKMSEEEKIKLLEYHIGKIEDFQT